MLLVADSFICHPANWAGKTGDVAGASAAAAQAAALTRSASKKNERVKFIPGEERGYPYILRLLGGAESFHREKFSRLSLVETRLAASPVRGLDPLQRETREDTRLYH